MLKIRGIKSVSKNKSVIKNEGVFKIVNHK